MTEDPPVRPEREGIVDGEPWQSPMYTPAEPLAIPADAPGLAVTYTGSAAAGRLVLFGSDREVIHAARLPAPRLGATMQVEIALDVGSEVGAFQLHNDCRCGSISLVSLDQRDLGPELRIDGDQLTLREGTQIVSENSTTAVRLPPDSGPLRILLKAQGIDYDTASVLEAGFERPSIDLLVEGPSGAVEFRVFPRNGTTDVRLYPEVLGFEPHGFRVDGRGHEVTLLEARRFDLPSDPRTSIPADPHTMLTFPQSAWRRDALEIFEWTAYPGTYFVDFADYATQSKYLKRLAFFTEKRGFRGTIPSHSAVEPLHGWNAHNYSAEGLYQFYRAAEENGVPLSDAELDLRETAVSLGLLTLEAGELRPGTGGLLSISRESAPVLRELLLTHESFHGVFYARESFREFVADYFRSMPTAGQAFWRSFLGFMSYDPADEYLMINEFQAYVLQQRPRATEWYMTERIGGRLEAAGSPAWRNMRIVLSQHPRFFRDAAEALNAHVLAHEGLLGGDVYTMLPAE